MATTTRQVILGKSVILEIDVRDARGSRIDADSQPEVSIINSNGAIVRALSITDVIRIQEGRYRYTYTVPSGSPTGVWIDHWRAVVNGFTTDARLNFIVLTSSAEIEVSGSQIGDDPQISYSEEEIIGINILLEMLQYRLKNKLQVESMDEYGNIEYVDCHVFTNDELVWFLRCSLSEFNQTPHFTAFTFADPVIYDRFAHVIVEGACIAAWAAQMLIEAGKEFNIQDNGISLSPPSLSGVLNNELSQFLSGHRDNLRYIKNSIKPHPIGFGGFRVLAVSPAYSRLRHLRERKIV